MGTPRLPNTTPNLSNCLCYFIAPKLRQSYETWPMSTVAKGHRAFSTIIGKINEYDLRTLVYTSDLSWYN